MEKLQRKLQCKENGNLERELSELYEILFSVSRIPYGKERKASSIRENEKQKEDEKENRDTQTHPHKQTQTHKQQRDRSVLIGTIGI